MLMFINFYFGEFTNISPSWFDWLSMILQIAAIFCAFLIAKYIFTSEKKVNIDNHENLLINEMKLFNSHLNKLISELEHSITNLNKCLISDVYKLQINYKIESADSNFIKFSYINEYFILKRLNNDSLNDLILSLSGFKNFNNVLIQEHRNFISQYQYFDRVLKKYKLILYTEYSKLCNSRGADFARDNDIVIYSFDENDKFMQEYTELRQKVMNNPDIKMTNGNINHAFIIPNFVQPLANLSFKFIPSDYNAIHINEICNEVISAYSDIQLLTNVYKKFLSSNITQLEDTILNIKKFQNTLN